LLIVVFVVFQALPAAGEGKTVYINDNIKVEKDAFKITTIRNLTEAEYYYPYSIDIIHGSVYLIDKKPRKVIKLSLQGYVMGRFGMRGEGPGDFIRIFGVSKLGDNIAIIGQRKVVICTKELEYIKEFKVEQRFDNLFLSTGNKIYAYNNPSFSNLYFSVYRRDFKFLRKFGIKKPGAKDWQAKEINFRNYKHSFDTLRHVVYVPGENGIWVSFRDRYDLRYYRNEKTMVNVKSKVIRYPTMDDTFSGVALKVPMGFSLVLGKDGNRLYYCYKLSRDSDFYCDIFDLSDNYRLVRRLTFPLKYWQLAYYSGSTLYGMRFDKEMENVLLDKIEIK
ncbi:MAG: hypothetical protein GY940_01920, partial [bacterium]|nr:hypothetical protein [bacterium]